MSMLENALKKMLNEGKITLEQYEAILPKLPTAGVDLIAEGKCPLNARTGHACMFCQYGHLTDCHYPKTCREAQCSHLARYQEAEC